MNKIKLLGLVVLILSIIGLLNTDGYGLLFGILAGLSIGWLITGKFIATKTANRRS
ncbi:hypothetical protein [Christiangramia portivictoriae]|uniref:hypothetical protein n=1 Tax=Christiangramia portivictoriae TaxID=326069 RepID=UPI000406469D|nr:hypothetical protein [Christiangramia portivictoriae]